MAAIGGTRRLARLFVVITVLAGSSVLRAPASAADGPDYSALVKELTKVQRTTGKMTMTFWMPESFWKLALVNSGRLSAQGISDTLAVVRPYTVVAVLDAQTLAIAGMNYTDEATLTKSTHIEDARGVLYDPIPQAQLSAGMQGFISAFRPMMANMMGAMGEHLVLMVFPGSDQVGRPIADTMGSGSLTVHVVDAAIRYSLPLASLLPPSMDPKSGESFPGTYKFNPYTGDKLTIGHWSDSATPPANP